MKSGKNASFEKAIDDVMAGVRAEPANVYCELLHVDQDPQTYLVIERYKDAAAAKAHVDSEPIKKFSATVKSNDLLDGPPEVLELVFMRSK